MGVDIDPAGGDEQAVRVDLALARPGLAADRRDLAAVDRDIAGERLAASAVEDAAAANDDVVRLRFSRNLPAQHGLRAQAAQSLALAPCTIAAKPL
jgi:hypothetical protein